MSTFKFMSHLVVFPCEIHSCQVLIPENTEWLTVIKMSIMLNVPLCCKINLISSQPSLSHCKNRPRLVNWGAEAVAAAAATAAGLLVWISWVVRHSLIKGSFHRRGGRLGSSGLCSHSQAEHLCHWYGTRSLWAALHLLRGSDEVSGNI